MAAIYEAVRSMPPRDAWEHWRRERLALYRAHQQSPVPVSERAEYEGPVYPFDPDLRVHGAVQAVEPRQLSLPHSGQGTTGAHAFGRILFTLGDREFGLTAYWLDDYGGGVFVPFRDTTNGHGTYRGGRYLLDTAKGADLGGEGDSVVLDFNFAYHPSCVHDTRWSCPLSPPENVLDIAVRGGERLP